MATYDIAKGGQAGYPAHLKGGTFRVAATVNFNANTGGTPYSAADVLEVINVPANTKVVDMAVIVEVEEGATCTMNVGDGDDADGYFVNVNANSAGTTALALALTEAAPNTVTRYTNGKFYSAADTIDLTLGHDTDAAKVTVVAFLRDMSNAE
jgi:hypothetical protein